MSITNGTLNDSKDQRRRRRDQIRDLREEAELKSLKRRQLRESYDDWPSDYLELLTREFRDWAPLGVPGVAGRRHGRLWPLYRTEQELRLLREPSRTVAATNPYAIGLIDAVCSYVIGTGYTYTVQVRGDDQYPGLAAGLQRIVDEFLLRNQFGGNDSGEIRLADADRDAGEQPSFEEEGFKRTCIDGDLIAEAFPNDDGTTDVRVVEPDQMTAPPSGIEFEVNGRCMVTTGNFETEGFGVISPKDDAQNPIAYYIQRGDTVADGDVVGTDRITHIRSNVWRTSKRGVPDILLDTLDAVRLANTLRGNLGEGAAQQAAIASITQHQSGSRDEIQSYNNELGDYERKRSGTDRFEWVRRYLRGEHIALGAGDQFVQGPGANNAVAHVSVLQALLRAFAVRWCGAEWLASGDSSNNNYASSLVANNHFVVAIKRRQKTLRSAYGMIVARALRHFVQTRGSLRIGERVYPAELILAVASIMVTVPDPTSVDPLQMTQKFQIECQNKVIDPKTWAEKSGYDWDQVKRNWLLFREEFPDAGTPLSVPPGFGGQTDGHA